MACCRGGNVARSLSRSRLLISGWRLMMPECGARHVQDHGVQGGGFEREGRSGVSPEGVRRRHAPAPHIELQFLEAAVVAVHRHQQAGVAHGLGQVGGLTAPAGADLGH